MFRLLNRWLKPKRNNLSATRIHGKPVRLLFEQLEDRLVPAAMLLTDKLDYSPGQTAIFSGTGFVVGEAINISVVANNGNSEIVSVVDGGANDMDGVADGRFSCQWIVDAGGKYLNATLVATATGSMGSSAVCTFTDSAGSITISGKKFNDLNGNGVFENGEPGIVGWTVYLDTDTDFSNGFLASVVTDANGSFMFTNGGFPYPAGETFVNLQPFTQYYVYEGGGPSSGWTQTLGGSVPISGDPNGPGVSGGNNAYPVRFTFPIQQSVNNNFGNHVDFVPNPAIQIVKHTNGSNNDSAPGLIVSAGTAITWTYYVTAAGTNEPIKNVVVVDDNGTIGNLSDDFSPTFTGGDSNSNNLLDVGETWTYTKVGGSAQAGQYTNNAVVTGNGNISNLPVTAQNPDNYFGVTPSIQIVKHTNGSNNDSAPGLIVSAGTAITWTYYVTATGTNEPIKNVVVVDDNGTIGNLSDDFSPTFTGGDSNSNNLLDVGETWTYTKVGGSAQAGQYTNNAVVTGNGNISNLPVTAQNPDNYFGTTPGIDIEKTTNGPTNSNSTAPDYDNEDALNGAGVPILTPGSSVTWTYKVTNTGTTTFTIGDIAIVDDNGTPSNTADDMSIGNGITFLSVQLGDADNLLEQGEIWLYTATGSVLDLTTAGAPATFTFSGSSPVSGTTGNLITMAAGGVSVNASAFSRDKSTGAWASAYLGAYGGGLGVTDSGESGSSNTHTVDNIGRDNYVLFEFSESVIVDSAFLGYVVGDSDLKVWIGTLADPFNNHVTLSDSVLSGLGFTEVNLTALSSSRLADLNAGNLAGNVLVIAADTSSGSADDQFKINQVTVRKGVPGSYGNKAVVTVPGATDFDLSHYKNPTLGSIGGTKYLDVSGNGLNLTASQYSPVDTPLAGTTIYLDLNNNSARDANEPFQVTGADGKYQFTNLAPGTYIVREIVGSDYVRTHPVMQDYYSVTVTNGSSATGYNFANAEKCDYDTVYNASYRIVHADGTSEVVSDLRGQTQEGDVITVTFYVGGDHPHDVTFVSYTAPEPYFNANTASQQKIYDIATGTFAPGGPYTLTVTIPNCYFQVDFVCGLAIDKLGPAGSNIFYTPQSRLESADNGGTHACCDNDGSISGYKYNDLNGNGMRDGNEPGLAGWVIYIDANGNDVKDANEFATVTRADGSYKLSNIAAGNYTGKVKEVMQAGWLQTDPPEIGSLAAGEHKTGVNFGNKYSASGTVSGYKFNDRNADGEWDKNGLDNCWNNSDDEVGLAGWTIFVDYNGNGTLDANEPSAVTASNGYYRINDVLAGTWDVVEVQQTNWIRTTDDATVCLTAGGNATNVNFGNFKGNLVMTGDTATIGFWNNKNGQSLIKKLNGSSTSKALGNWLAAQFPNIYGSNCGPNNLANKTNAQVALYFQSLFNVSGQKLNAQVLATALAVYVTSSNLSGGTYASRYGFNVSAGGIQYDYYNIGNNAAAFNASGYPTIVDDSALTVWDILKRTNARAVNGSLWNGNTTLRNMGNVVFSGINQAGDIG